ncbi:hypothetical protein QNK06_06470 [Bacillus subtilis]|uniref:hypothetical protein n=1 Tax=Bacillus subtilis TaxID=1423 RepID=UPI0024C1B941|nr:hypothetical protein [Bacillus subtilis]MDL2030918.1 hypothetical protein [Bacillus subtilis]WHY10705.1 hypothetical protein QNK06_06470 [Bacillus subtilis]WPP26857.1 hypothetical protein SIS06_06825 [Bacillus subtilis]
MSKEINTKELDEELKRVLKMFDDVLEVYEQHDGEPDIIPGVTCPSCQKNQLIMFVTGMEINMYTLFASVAVECINKKCSILNWIERYCILD